MVLAERCFASSEGAAEERLGLVHAAEPVHHSRKVVHHGQGPLVVRSQAAFKANEALVEDALGLVQGVGVGVAALEPGSRETGRQSQHYLSIIHS